MRSLLVFALSCAALSGTGCGEDAPSSNDAGASDASVDLVVADSAQGDAGIADSGDVDMPSITHGVVYVVLFTHIEDTSPSGTLGTEMSRNNYTSVRSKMIEMGELMMTHGLTWVLQPDWKYLEAALMYEDATLTATTGGKNLFRYLAEDLDVVIDPHSHESMMYNYTDVAYLLEQLGVGGSTVIGGHVWDPALPQFQEWDRFRVPVAGETYPSASWRGDILIGAGTPGHVNDPNASGVWHPQDRNNFFVDDPTGNIVVVGAWHDDVAGVQELVDRFADGTVPANEMLTASWNISPMEIMAPSGLDDIETDVLIPIDALRDAGSVVVTDFTSLVATWRASYAGEAYLYQP